MNTKRLHELMSLPRQAQNWAEVCVYGVSSDSRQVKQGDLFITCLGEPKRQRSYIEQAQGKGAAAVAIDMQQATRLDLSSLTVPIIGVDNLAAKQGAIAARFFNEPSTHLSLIGVTGTNGKTSCSHFIAQCHKQLGISCGVIGTLGYGFIDALEDAPNTTPDEVTLQVQLGKMLSAGAKACALEVSSHGLDQGRLSGCHFKTAIFTNLTQDHLDYHGTMQAYGEVKSRLFKWPSLEHAVINVDDDLSELLLKKIASNVVVCRYSADVEKSTQVEVGVSYVVQNGDGLEAMVQTPKGDALLQVGIIGRFNLSNLLATLSVLLIEGFDLNTAMASINNLATVPGRMQLVKQDSNDKKPQAIVDYAHTPDALQKALVAAKEHSGQGQLWLVFGCGGDRDTGKRAKMASIAEQFADHVIVTDDNPRSEPSQKIIDDICEGFSGTKEIIIKNDRSLAISYAMQSANASDIVLIAGKGHETYQETNDKKIHFSDQEQVLSALMTGGTSEIV